MYFNILFFSTVLTYKMERMILDQSQSYLPLTVHAANSQSTSEEQWTDFDAISVISSTDTARKLIQNPGHADVGFPATSWDVELLQFKHSILRDKKKLKINSKTKDILSTIDRSSDNPISQKRSLHQNDPIILQTFGPAQESTQSNLHYSEQHLVSEKLANHSQTSDKDFLSDSHTEPPVRLNEIEIDRPEDGSSKNLLKHLNSRRPQEKKLQKSTSSHVNNYSGTSVQNPRLVEEDSYDKESISVEHLHEGVSSQEFPAADDLVLGIEQEYAVDAELEPLEEAVSEVDLDTESVHSAPPVFLSKKKKSRLAKQESKEKGRLCNSSVLFEVLITYPPFL